MSLGFDIGICMDGGTQTSYQVDSAWVFGTSGEAWVLRFQPPVNQTSGTLIVNIYVDGAVTGSPTYVAELRNGPAVAGDPDRPEAGGAALDSSSAVAAVADSWMTLTLSASTLDSTKQYYLVGYNSHATPASNYASLTHRGACDGHRMVVGSNAGDSGIFQTGYTTNGFTTDPFMGVTTGMSCLEFDDGTPMGFGYVSSESHASNANDRGNRISLTGPMSVYGHGWTDATSVYSGGEINQGATNIVAVSADTWGISRSNKVVYPYTTLSQATPYDCVVTLSGSSTIGTIYTYGEVEASVPASVLATRMFGTCAYVDGTTPGSYAVDTSKALAMIIYIGDLVAPAGGGGCKLAGSGGGMVG